MKVKFLANACACGYGYANGAEVELETKQAEEAIKAGCAVLVEETETKKAKEPKLKKVHTR